MVRSGGKPLIITAIVVSLIGITTGLLLGGNFLQSNRSNIQYAEKPTSIKTETVVVEHSHDGLPMHKHTVTMKQTTTETTPHYDFHNFPQSVPSGRNAADTTQTVSNPPTPPINRPQDAGGANEPYYDEAAHQWIFPSSGNSTQNTTVAAPTTGNASQTTAGPKAYEVWLFYDSVVPASITVPKGSTVTWINKDRVDQHTVNSDDNNGPLNMIISPGMSFSFTFTEAGTFRYHCEPHPHLVGVVIVK